jgi:hypothetical protein
MEKKNWFTFQKLKLRLLWQSHIKWWVLFTSSEGNIANFAFVSVLTAFNGVEF